MADLAVDWKNPDYAPVWAERMRRLAWIRDKDEGAKRLAGLKAHYKGNPCDFVHDWGCTYDPRNAEVGLPTTMPFLLFPKQEEFIDWVVDHWKRRKDGLTEKSRDMGVSWLSVAIAVWMWLFYPGSSVGFGSRKEEYVDRIGDPKCLFWKLRTFVDMLPAEFKPAGYDSKKHAPFMRLLNPENGASVIGEAGSNIGRGARTSIYFKDESAFYEQPEAVDAALSQTSNCKVDVSTPNGVGNPFWQKRHGGKIDVFIFDWKDDPRKGPDWYEKQKATLDVKVLAQEVDRDYSASVDNSYIDAARVGRAAERGPADVSTIGKLRVGIDPARFGNDKTVITFRRGRLCIKQVAWGKTDIASTAGRAKQEINAFREKPEQIAVDTIGVGAGVADILRGWFPPVDDGTGKPTPIVVDVNSSLRMDDGRNYNLRAFMYSELKEWLLTASIPNEPDLIGDLTATRYGYRAGELLLESKDDMKAKGIKSPDHADSLALTFAIPTVKDTTPRIPAGAVATYGPTDPDMGM